MPTKTYKVIGAASILDHKPGEKFTADIPAEQERFLISIGGLKVVDGEKRVEPPKSPISDLPKPAPIKTPAVPIPNGDAD